jgi:hypothetical protein
LLLKPAFGTLQLHPLRRIHPVLVTVTNVSAATINNLITGGSGVSSDAVGGSKNNPLPYPFAHIGPLAASGTKQLPMHPGDWHYKPVPWLPLDPATEWNQLVQRTIVTLTVADQTGVRDSEEKYQIEVG